MTARESLGQSLLRTVAVAVLVLSLAGEVAAAPTVHTVIIDKMKFGPLPAKVRSGDTIVWVNKDIFKHTATAQDKSFNVELPPKTSRRTVIKHSGATAFYCIYHPGMRGTLNVAR